MKFLTSALVGLILFPFGSGLSQTPASALQAPSPQTTTASQDINQQLLEAAERGDKELVESLLAKGADKNAKNKEGSSVLRLAAARGYADLVDILLAAKADVNVKANNGETALIAAADEGHAEIVERLLKAAADPNATDEKGYTALMAAIKGDVREVEALLTAKADVNAKANDGGTALMFAAVQGRLVMVQRLLAAGADVNAKDKDARTALMYAAEGRTPCVTLVSAAKGEHAQGDYTDVVNALVAAGADPNVKTGSFTDVKCQLLSNGNLAVFPVKVKDWTALKAAKKGGHRDIVELLKKAGAKE